MKLIDSIKHKSLVNKIIKEKRIDINQIKLLNEKDINYIFEKVNTLNISINDCNKELLLLILKVINSTDVLDDKIINNYIDVLITCYNKNNNIGKSLALMLNDKSLEKTVIDNVINIINSFLDNNDFFKSIRSNNNKDFINSIYEYYFLNVKDLDNKIIPEEIIQSLNLNMLTKEKKEKILNKSIDLQDFLSSITYFRTLKDNPIIQKLINNILDKKLYLKEIYNNEGIEEIQFLVNFFGVDTVLSSQTRYEVYNSFFAKFKDSLGKPSNELLSNLNILFKFINNYFLGDPLNPGNFTQTMYELVKAIPYKESNLTEDILKERLNDFIAAMPDAYLKFSYIPNSFVTLNNVPIKLGEKYDKRQLTYDDVLNNLKYFDNTNISVGLSGLNPKLRGIFTNEAILQLLKDTLGDIEIINKINPYKIKPKLNTITYKQFIEDIYKYINENKITEEQLLALRSIGFYRPYVDDILDNIDLYSFYLSHYNDDVRIFQSKIMSNFDIDFINNINAKGRIEPFLQIINSGIGIYDLKQILDFLKKNNCYDYEMYCAIIDNYKNVKNLLFNLINNNETLKEKDVINLLEIISNNNYYSVSNYTELSNYLTFKHDKLKSLINSDKLYEAKNAILTVLFGNAEIDLSPISNIQDTKYKFSQEFLFSVGILNKIKSCQDINELRQIFNVALNNNIYTRRQINEELAKIVSNDWNNQLTTVDKDDKRIKADTIQGVDSKVCKTDVNGNPISRNDEIQVYDLNGIDFKLIIHTTGAMNMSSSTANVVNNIKQNPAIWNKFVGGNVTLSTSIATNRFIGTFNTTNPLVFGFSHIPEDVLKDVEIIDAGTTHDDPNPKRGMSTGFIANNIDSIVANSDLDHNELVLYRQSLKEKNNFDGRVQPTCIISFSSKIDDFTKLAAQYFRVPIYIIDKKLYMNKEIDKLKKYMSGNIDIFTFADIDNILYSPLYDKPSDFEFNDVVINKTPNKIDLCLELNKKIFNERKISEKEYIDNLKHIQNVIKNLNLSITEVQKEMIESEISLINEGPKISI